MMISRSKCRPRFGHPGRYRRAPPISSLHQNRGDWVYDFTVHWTDSFRLILVPVAEPAADNTTSPRLSTNLIERVAWKCSPAGLGVTIAEVRATPKELPF